MTVDSAQIVRRVTLAILLVTCLNAQSDLDAVRPFTGLGGSGCRAAGLAMSFTGVADDFTALYYNPAGLAHLTRVEINLGLSHLSVTTDVSNTSGDNTGRITATRLNNIGFALPVPEIKLTIAAGYHQLRSFERQREQILSYGTGSVIEEVLTEEGNIGSWSLGAGYQVTPKLALGGAIDFLTGRNIYTNIDTYLTGGVVDSSTYEQFEPDYSGVGVTMGILLAPWQPWRIGLLLRSPQWINIKENFIDDSDMDWPVYEYSTRCSYSLRLGSSLTLGPLLISGDLSWFDYSQIRFESDFIGDTDIVNNEILRTRYAIILSYSVGAELLLPGINTKLRGGYRSDPPITGDSPAEMIQNTFSFGLSVVPMPQIKIDIGYNLTTWERDIGDAGKEQIFAGNAMVNLIYRF
ncbi:OmpP1/FadL family transporter [Candidatus Neomarinimicrobiota bacterium]